VAGSKCDGSIFRTVPHVGRPALFRFAVTSVQLPPPPPSFVTHTLPSFVPAQIRPRWISDGAIAKTSSP
jgi:hypothetical protein